MDSFLENLGNKATNPKTGSSNPEQQQHQQTHHKASPTDLLSDAKVVAEAAQSALNHDTSKIDRARVAGAAENILDAAQHYGKLDEKGMGKYVDKAEGYLHKYNSSAPSGTGSTAAHAAQPPHSGEKKEGHSEGGGGGIGDYAKMAQGFLKKE